MRAECLNSGVERSITASRMHGESILNAIFTREDAQMNLYIVGRSDVVENVGQYFQRESIE